MSLQAGGTSRREISPVISGVSPSFLSPPFLTLHAIICSAYFIHSFSIARRYTENWNGRYLHSKDTKFWIVGSLSCWVNFLYQPVIS